MLHRDEELYFREGCLASWRWAGISEQYYSYANVMLLWKCHLKEMIAHGLTYPWSVGCPPCYISLHTSIRMPPLIAIARIKLLLLGRFLHYSMLFDYSLRANATAQCFAAGDIRYFPHTAGDTCFKICFYRWSKIEQNFEITFILSYMTQCRHRHHAMPRRRIIHDSIISR